MTGLEMGMGMGMVRLRDIYRLLGILDIFFLELDPTFHVFNECIEKFVVVRL